ncbi:MAG: metallophosphoesterase [Prevotella sp.]|nr:metallophosphoesterase [Prevotella sp.]
MKRREFLKNTALLAVATGAPGVANAAGLIEKHVDANASDAIGQTPDQTSDGRLIVSAPMLQNYAETSMGVAFAVSDMANGYVVYGEKPDLSDGRKVMCGGYRTTDISDKVIQVRLTGLKPSTTYYYRIGADRISYKGGYNMKILGTEDDGRIYRFTTAGRKSKSHFCVINDTHVQWEPIRRAVEKIAALSPQCVVWNGDASNSEETIEAQMRIYLTPSIERRDYASEIPYLFCPGNHDSRGMANRHLERVWMYRQPEERNSRDWDLGRNFAVRMGDIAMIGLDTAEDKLDTNPIFAGLFNSKAYREAQVAWLRDALSQKEIASAPYLIAFCHIPLFDSDPTRNPGDVSPADKDPQYTTDFAMWQRTCAQMWTPLLEKARCQLIITAHQHCYRYDAPTKTRPWAQIVGGGPEMVTADSGEKLKEKPQLFPTVIEGEVVGKRLRMTIHNLRTGKVQETIEFKPR